MDVPGCKGSKARGNAAYPSPSSSNEREQHQGWNARPEKYFLGIEGSANKLGIGIVDSCGKIISNLRKTFIPPVGSGFLPGETARHHRQHIVQLLVASLSSSRLSLEDLEAICFTKGLQCFVYTLH